MLARRRFLRAGACATALVPAIAQSRSARPTRPAPLPAGYVSMGQRYGVPPLVLYGVALQESKMRFGEQALPYPWTLCVRGQARRYRAYGQAVTELRQLVASGVTNVDCGCMQVNWHWHQRRLGSCERALDPYPNIAVGAQILREHFDTCRDWFRAVGRYHHPSDPTRASVYATSVFRRIPQIPGIQATPSKVLHG
jgi:hypothetical protein